MTDTETRMFNLTVQISYFAHYFELKVRQQFSVKLTFRNYNTDFSLYVMLSYEYA